jgi:tetratricopeptide (TPR) repeat protein
VFEQSLNIAREIGNKPWEAKTLSQIGRYFHRLGDYVRAQIYYEQSLEIYRQVGNKLSESRVLSDTSLLYHHLGDDATAEQKSKAAFVIAEELNHPKYLGQSLTQIGRAKAGLGQLDEAIKAYQGAWEKFSEVGQKNLSMESLAGLAGAQLANGDQTAASKHVEDILDHLEQSQDSDSGETKDAVNMRVDSEAGAVPGLEGTNDPLWIYLTCYKVLKSIQDQRTDDVLKRAQSLLEEQASKIEDPDLNYSFLNNVETNREIQAESGLGGTR